MQSRNFSRISIQGSFVSLSLLNSQIRDNSLGEEGGGLFCKNCDSVKILNSSFSNLRSQRGGALYFEILSFKKQKVIPKDPQIRVKE